MCACTYPTPGLRPPNLHVHATALGMGAAVLPPYLAELQVTEACLHTLHIESIGNRMDVIRYDPLSLGSHAAGSEI